MASFTPDLVEFTRRARVEPLSAEQLDALALDVIRDVGPGGHFMAHRHTRENLRDFHLTLWQKVAETAAGRGEASPASASVPRVSLEATR